MLAKCRTNVCSHLEVGGAERNGQSQSSVTFTETKAIAAQFVSEKMVAWGKMGEPKTSSLGS